MERFLQPWHSCPEGFCRSLDVALGDSAEEWLDSVTLLIFSNPNDSMTPWSLQAFVEAPGIGSSCRSCAELLSKHPFLDIIYINPRILLYFIFSTFI